MGMDTDAVRWFQQVADGVTVTEVSELERVTFYFDPELGAARTNFRLSVRFAGHPRAPQHLTPSDASLLSRCSRGSFRWLDRLVGGGGSRLVVGSGSGLSEESAPGCKPTALESESFPVCPPGLPRIGAVLPDPMCRLWWWVPRA